MVNSIEKNRDEYLMLSGIQHYYFCKRQWALIHLEQVWSDNILTFGGNNMHEKVDDPYLKESRGKYFISRSLPVYSDLLKLYGICDVVEFVNTKENGIKIKNRKGYYNLVPIEYKYGKEKQSSVDIVQLVAQAICLEEMFKCQIDIGYLYYGRTKSRVEVKITKEMRDDVINISKSMWEVFSSFKIPKAEYKTHCRKCSLYNLCEPKLNTSLKDIDKYFEKCGDLKEED